MITITLFAGLLFLPFVVADEGMRELLNINNDEMNMREQIKAACKKKTMRRLYGRNGLFRNKRRRYDYGGQETSHRYGGTSRYNSRPAVQWSTRYRPSPALTRYGLTTPYNTDYPEPGESSLSSPEEFELFPSQNPTRAPSRSEGCLSSSNPLPTATWVDQDSPPLSFLGELSDFTVVLTMNAPNSPSIQTFNFGGGIFPPSPATNFDTISYDPEIGWVAECFSTITCLVIYLEEWTAHRNLTTSYEFSQRFSEETSQWSPGVIVDSNTVLCVASDRICSGVLLFEGPLDSLEKTPIFSGELPPPINFDNLPKLTFAHAVAQ